MSIREGSHATSLRVRVGYVDTDQGRVVHHASYLRYLEAARIEHMRASGLDYKSFEFDQKLALPVVEANLRYKLPAHFDDLLVLRTWISSVNRAKVRFDSLILRDDKLLTTASIALCCVKLPEGKLISIPKAIIALGPEQSG